MTHLLCSSKFVLLNLSHLFLPAPPPSFGNHLFVLCIYDCLCLVMVVHLICFLDSTCKWNHRVFFFFLCVTYDTNIIPSRSIQVVTNSKISFFNPYGWVILHCIHILYLCYLSISLWTNCLLSFSLCLSVLSVVVWIFGCGSQWYIHILCVCFLPLECKLSEDRDLLWLIHFSLPRSWRVMPDM